MEHGSDLIAAEDAGDHRRVRHVAGHQFNIAGNQRIPVAVFQGIQHHDTLIRGGGGKVADSVGTDITSAAGNEDGRREGHGEMGKLGNLGI